MKGSFFSWSVGIVLRCVGTRDFCPALAALVGLVNFFLLTVHYFSSFVPVAWQAEQAGSRARSPLSLICFSGYQLNIQEKWWGW
jgi:hypothetical protein